MYSAALLLGIGLFAAALPQAPAKQLDGVYNIPLRRIDDNNGYGMEVGVGTPPQMVTLLVDTGSNTYSVESSEDIYCQEGMCKETGTFDNTTSSTYKYVTGGFNNVVSNIGTSDIISETLLVAGSTLEGMKLGYVVRHGRNTTRQLPAIAGLSLGCEKGRCNHTRSFTQALYEAGHIKKRAYSIFLGLGDGSVPGQLLMGGIDRAKRQGPVYKHKLAGAAPVDFTYEGADKNVLWDSGSPWWYAPVPVFRNVTQYFGLPADTPLYDGQLEVDCKFRTPNDDTLVVIMDGADELPIPMWQLLNVRADSKCYLDMMGVQGAFGDSFVRNVYLTYDYEEMTIEVSMAKYTTETDIVPIE